MRHRLLARLGALLLLVLIAATGLIGGSARIASAHAALESSTPAANSVLEQGPDSIVLDFDEAVEGDLASIQLFDGKGDPVQLGTPSPGADTSIVVATAPALGDGIYAVIWRVTSADGHVVDGAFSFQVGTAAVGDGKELIDLVRNGVRSAPAIRWWYGVARFLSLAGAIGSIGGGWWLLFAGPPADERRNARRLSRLCWLALLLGSMFAFGLFGAEAVAGSARDVLRPSVWGDVATTQTGRMLLLRVVFALLFGVLLLVRRQRAQGWWRAAASTTVVFTLYTFSASGHPSVQHPTALWIAIDMVHLAAIAIWIGGLLTIAVIGKLALVEPGGDRLAKRFSLVALLAVPVVIATGVAQTLRLAGGLDDVSATDWGRVLLTKVTVVAALLALAGVSRWLLRHDGAASIRRTVVAEAVLGLVVVGMAAGMVALPPVPAPAAQEFSEQLVANGLIAVVSVGPGSVGSNEVHILITPPGGSLTPVASATARVSLPEANIPFSPVTLVDEGPNHYSGTIVFPRSGSWTFEIIVQVTASDSALLKTTVPIP